MRERWLTLMRRNVLAFLVLCVAIGGGTVYAAGKLGSKDIAKNAVRSRQLAPHALAAKHGIIRTLRINISDPHPNTSDFTTKRLLRYGPFTIRGSCLDAGVAYYSKASISSREEAFGSGIDTGSNAPMFHKTPVPILPASGSAQPNAVHPRAVTAVTRSGKLLSIQVFAAIKAAGAARDGKPDCTFWVQGLGRQ